MSMQEENLRAAATTTASDIATGHFHIHPWMSALMHGLKSIREGELKVILPDGEAHIFGQPSDAVPSAEWRFYSYNAPKRMLKEDDIGLGESYIQGEWSTPDLYALLTLFLQNEQHLNNKYVRRGLVKLQQLYRKFADRNNRRGSRRNIEFHYDLGNSFYEKWLDPSMTYSSALFETADMSLQQAQVAKYRKIVELAAIKPGDKVLEIGCGWGGFAELATETEEISVVGLTLSKEQHAYAKARLATLKRDTQTDFKLQDYRDHQGQYDAIVSIEMFEAVGEKNWPSYFSALHQNLKPGGRAAVQVITIDEDRFDSYRGKLDYIQKHIFPGGFLPSKTAFCESAERAKLKVRPVVEFGRDYAKTLRLWHEEFINRWPEIRANGFDERFKRKWEFYLKYCEAGFDHGSIDVVIFELEKAHA